MVSATSKRCSSVHGTIWAASGVRSGQFRQSPPLTWSNVSLPRGPSADAAVERTGAFDAAGSAVTQPGDEQTAERRQQQGTTGRGGLQTLPPRSPLGRLLRRVEAQRRWPGCIQHRVHCDRRAECCDKSCSCKVMWLCPGGRNCPADLRSAAPKHKSRVAVVIDLKLLREDPDRVRASQRARGSRIPASSTRCWTPTPPAAPRSRPPTTCAPSRRRPASRSARPPRRTGPRCWRAPRNSPSRSRRPRPRRPPPSSALTAAHMAISNVIIDGVPAGGEDDFVGARDGRRARVLDASEGPPRTRRGARPDRHGARRQGVRVAVLLPHRLRRAAAARA